MNHEIKIENVDINSLKDIRNITVDTRLPKEERMIEFVKQIENPYCFRCGNIIVQIAHNETERTITDCLKDYIESQVF